MAREVDQRWQEPVLLAASWSATIERTIDLLPRSRRQVELQHNERVAHRPGVQHGPQGRYFVNPEHGRPLLGDDRCPRRMRTRSTADIVMVGRMADKQLRYRAFYLDPSRPLALAAQERPAGATRSGLLDGVEVQRLVRGRIGALVPEVHEALTTRVGPRTGWWGWRPRPRPVALPHTVDVVVEEWVPGRPVVRTETDVADELLATVGDLWSLEPVVSSRLDPAVLQVTIERFRELELSPDPHQLWPEGMDRHALARRVLPMLEADPQVSIGLSHGDPGLGNALRTDTGRLVLVDWEDADRRTLSHDVLKILASAQIPPERWADHHPVLPASARSGALPLQHQLAVALLQFLAGWPGRTRKARRRGSLPAHRDRMHRMLRAVDALLD